jgi:hypothetical protein
VWAALARRQMDTVTQFFYSIQTDKSRCELPELFVVRGTRARSGAHTFSRENNFEKLLNSVQNAPKSNHQKLF